MVDGGPGGSAPEEAPLTISQPIMPDAGGAGNNSALNAPTAAPVAPGQMAAPQIPGQQPAMPEAMPGMPQMPQNPESMKPVTPEDVRKAGDDVLKKGLAKGAAYANVMHTYEGIKIEPLNLKL